MSYHVFFSFSTGLAKPVSVPKGSKGAIAAHVLDVESKLGLKRVKFKKNPVHWDSFKMDFSKVDDQLLCETVEQHNGWVRMWYENLAAWAKKPFTKGSFPPPASETITPEEAQEFWHGFQMLSVPPSQWTREYYVSRMEHLYEAMRGRPSEGVVFDARALKPEQAAAVIGLFEEYLDSHDMRLDVPKGRDYLASSYDGGYEWCEKCGAVTPDDGENCSKRKCPIRAEHTRR